MLDTSGLGSAHTSAWTNSCKVRGTVTAEPGKLWILCGRKRCGNTGGREPSRVRAHQCVQLLAARRLSRIGAVEARPLKRDPRRGKDLAQQTLAFGALRQRCISKGLLNVEGVATNRATV